LPWREAFLNKLVSQMSSSKSQLLNKIIKNLMKYASKKLLAIISPLLAKPGWVRKNFDCFCELTGTFFCRFHKLFPSNSEHY
jgi:hypothetical protein